jgi:hypothetical protein
MGVWYQYTARTLTSFLRGQKKAPLEQIEARTAKHLAFEHFQAIHVALHRAIAPAQGQAHLGVGKEQRSCGALHEHSHVQDRIMCSVDLRSLFHLDSRAFSH